MWADWVGAEWKRRLARSGLENCFFSTNCGGCIWWGIEFAASSDEPVSQPFPRILLGQHLLLGRAEDACWPWISWAVSDRSNFQMTFDLVKDPKLLCINQLLSVLLLWCSLRAHFQLQQEEALSSSLIFLFFLYLFASPSLEKCSYHPPRLVLQQKEKWSRFFFFSNDAYIVTFIRYKFEMKQLSY